MADRSTYNSMKKDDLVDLILKKDAKTNRYETLLCSDIVKASIAKPDPDRDPDGKGDMEWHVVLENNTNPDLPSTSVACIPMSAIRLTS